MFTADPFLEGRQNNLETSVPVKGINSPLKLDLFLSVVCDVFFFSYIVYILYDMSH